MTASEKLNPHLLALPDTEIHRLYVGLGALYDALIHDLGGDLGLMHIRLEDAESAVRSLVDMGLSPGAQEQVQRVRDVLADANKVLGRFAHTVYRLGPKTSSDGNPLVSVPWNIASELASVLGPDRVQVSETSPKALEILFPHGCLDAVMYELVANALRTSEATRVKISWTRNHHVFTLVIDDDGPGFAGVMPGATLLVTDLQLERNSGLAFWDKTFRRLGGMIAIGRSSGSSGASVSVRIPVPALYDESEQGHGRVEVTQY